MAVAFLIVETIVLEAGCHAVFLYFLNVRHTHLPRQIRVFAHILEIASVIWCTVDIDARSQKHILLTVACLFSYALAVEGGKIAVPACSKTGQCRECRAGIIGPSGLVPLIPEHFRTYAVRAVGGP